MKSDQPVKPNKVDEVIELIDRAMCTAEDRLWQILRAQGVKIVREDKFKII